MEKEIVKIKTKQGRIITLTVSQRTSLNIWGNDKYGKFTMIPLKDIDSCLPVELKEDG